MVGSLNNYCNTESDPRICNVIVERRMPCDRVAILTWEQKHSCVLPEDLRNFYASTDGFQLTWHYKYSADEVLPVGAIRVNPLSQLSLTTALKDLVDFSLTRQSSGPRPVLNTKSKIFELDTCRTIGKLVHEPTRIPDVVGHTEYCLDLLLTTDPDGYSVCVSPPLGTSDDCLVKSVSLYSPPELSTKTPGVFGDTSQRIGIRCDTFSRLILGGSFVFLPRINRAVLMLFQVRYCKVCLIYTAGAWSVWLATREGVWGWLADSFTNYFRMALVHLGLPGWQAIYANLPLIPWAEQLFLLLAPHLLEKNDGDSNSANLANETYNHIDSSIFKTSTRQHKAHTRQNNQ